MTNPAKSRVALILLAGMAVLGAQSVRAQTYQVIYRFTGGLDGDQPRNGVTFDRAGNMYGVALTGGDPNCPVDGGGCGSVFRLTHRGSGWIFSLLYDFHGTDGYYPWGEIVLGPDGVPYGTTELGGTGNTCNDYGGCGTIYKLQPPTTATANAEAGWTETLLYTFTRGGDGASPIGPVIFDGEGNLYLSPAGGGMDDYGVIAEFAPEHGGWTEHVLHSFTGGNDGVEPTGGVILDNLGNVYGTTLGSPGDQVFQLTLSGGFWTKHTLHEFQGGTDGQNPWGGLIFDSNGNLYGTTGQGGLSGAGTVFKLSPSGGGWDYSVIHTFQGPPNDLCGPGSGVIMDAAGRLYGTTVCDGANQRGSVFKLTPSGSGWTYTSLYDFTGGDDGGEPTGRLAFDADGNLYGTTSVGGGSGCGGIGCGVVFEVTP